MKSPFDAIRDRAASVLGRLAKASRPSAGDELFQYSAKTATIFVNVFDVATDRLGPIVEACSRRHANRKLIFLTNNSDLAKLRGEGRIVEYFVPVDTIRRLGGDRDWARYLKDRMDLVVLKWRPDWRIDYGTRFEDYLTAAEDAIQASAIPGAGRSGEEPSHASSYDPTVRGA